MNNPQDYLSAMKATFIPVASSGRWLIERAIFNRPVTAPYRNRVVSVPAGVYTFLRCLTEATMHELQPGEVVMEDTPTELVRHMGFILQARGQVLVTGLGLGCVVRGLLANPAVDQVTVIENSPDVLRLVGPYMPAKRLEIIQADALEWTLGCTRHFDCAWHDVWTDRNAASRTWTSGICG
jgi:spermidine synthase